MKFVFAPDSFKGTLSSQEISTILSQKAKEIFGNVQTVSVIIADGGEGTIEAMAHQCGGKKRYVDVKNPLGKTIKAHYLALSDKKALIEMATASGITLIPHKISNALKTTSYGTGELIKNALDNNVEEIIISIGGSATNDGGIGMLNALGVQFLDENNAPLNPIGENLIKIKTIDTSSMDKRINKTKFTVMCDVTNPLLGQKGATYVFGKQKGANEHHLALLEDGMVNYAHKIKEFLGVDITTIAGGGAAGGMGAGLVAFCNAQMKSGIKTILELIDFKTIIKNADLIVTGEGRVDSQSADGKVLDGIGSYAKKEQIPVVALCGGMGNGANAIYNCGIDSIMVTPNSPMSLDEALQNAPALLEDSAERMFKMIKIGMSFKQSVK